MKKKRIAVFGGDDRTERLEWPEHLDVRVYPYKSPRSLDRLRQSASSGSLDHIVMLTSYMAHRDESSIRGMGVGFTRWSRSPGELARQIGTMFPPPPPEPVNPLLQPTAVHDPNTGGGRGPIPTKLTEEARAEPPRFEHLVAVPPAPDESLGQALRRILKAEDMTQMDLCRLLGKSPATVSCWIRDTYKPKDMGPLIDLWPELSRFDGDLAQPSAPPPKPKEPEPTAEKRELVDLVRSVKVDLDGHPPSRDEELRRRVERWRRARLALEAAKKELEAAESELLALL